MTHYTSGEIFRGIKKHCKNAALTLDASKASYILEAQMGKGSTNKPERSWLTVFDKNGDAIFTTSPLETGNAVKDVCNFLKLEKH